MKVSLRLYLLILCFLGFQCRRSSTFFLSFTFLSFGLNLLLLLGVNIRISASACIRIRPVITARAFYCIFLKFITVAVRNRIDLRFYTFQFEFSRIEPPSCLINKILCGVSYYTP